MADEKSFDVQSPKTPPSSDPIGSAVPPIYAGEATAPKEVATPSVTPPAQQVYSGNTVAEIQLIQPPTYTYSGDTVADTQLFDPYANPYAQSTFEILPDYLLFDDPTGNIAAASPGSGSYNDAYNVTWPDYGTYTPDPTEPVVTAAAGTLGLDGTLNEQQLADAGRLTALAMFGPYYNSGLTGDLPNKISIELADELAPFIVNPHNQNLKDVYMENFGVEGFESSAQFLETLGYTEVEPGKWFLLPPGQSSIAASGPNYYRPPGYGYGGYGGYGGYSSRGAYGGNLVNWRIGL